MWSLLVLTVVTVNFLDCLPSYRPFEKVKTQRNKNLLVNLNSVALSTALVYRKTGHMENSRSDPQIHQPKCPLSSRKTKKWFLESFGKWETKQTDNWNITEYYWKLKQAKLNVPNTDTPIHAACTNHTLICFVILHIWRSRILQF
jgi:hypothetical protein